ncbi:hypothetical protein Tco_0550367 [Tanacetum coccineum]
MAAFKVLETQFQMFIKSRIYLDDEYVDMTRNKFLQYTRLDIPEFRDTLIQHMESVKCPKVIIESNVPNHKAMIQASQIRNDAHVDDAEIQTLNNRKSQWLSYKRPEHQYLFYRRQQHTDNLKIQ